jgi:hypothetical protein
MVEICLKMVEYAQFKFNHHFWSDFVNLVEIRPMVGFLCADPDEIRPVWKHFDQIWRKFDQKWWSNLNYAYSTVFQRISAILAENKITV